MKSQTQTTQEGQKTYTDVNKAAVDGGYEGIRSKILMHPMNAKDHCMVKTKPFIEVSLKSKQQKKAQAEMLANWVL